MRIPAAGGEPVSLFSPDDGQEAWHPQVLSGGDVVLFTLADRTLGTRELHLLTVTTGEYQLLLSDASTGRVLDTGHLVFMRGNSLWAVPFDRENLEVVGDPVRVVEGIRRSGGGQFEVTNDGSLVYAAESGGVEARNLVWLDRVGQEQPVIVPARDVRNMSLSPDGSKAAVEIRTPDGATDVWVAELARGTLTPITTETGDNGYPLWSRDGQSVVFTSRREGLPVLLIRSADGTGEAEILATSGEPFLNLRPNSWSPDGALAIEIRGAVDTTTDIGLVLPGATDWRPLIQTGVQEEKPAISPDGQWIAYESHESGERQVYVQRFPDLGDRQPVTVGPSSNPTWSRDGRELYVLGGEAPGSLLRVSIVDGLGGIELSRPEAIVDFSRYFGPRGQHRTYDVSLDGRLLLIAAGDAEAFPETQEINVVLDWSQELSERVPVP